MENGNKYLYIQHELKARRREPRAYLFQLSGKDNQMKDNTLRYEVNYNSSMDGYFCAIFDKSQIPYQSPFSDTKIESMEHALEWALEQLSEVANIIQPLDYIR